ncbi:hypothetical protein PRUPE_1G307800, partial [Prunus persica]
GGTCLVFNSSTALHDADVNGILCLLTNTIQNKIIVLLAFPPSQLPSTFSLLSLSPTTAHHLVNVHAPATFPTHTSRPRFPKPKPTTPPRFSLSLSLSLSKNNPYPQPTPSNISQDLPPDYTTPCRFSLQVFIFSNVMF